MQKKKRARVRKFQTGWDVQMPHFTALMKYCCGKTITHEHYWHGDGWSWNKEWLVFIQPKINFRKFVREVIK